MDYDALDYAEGRCLQRDEDGCGDDCTECKFNSRHNGKSCDNQCMWVLTETEWHKVWD